MVIKMGATGCTYASMTIAKTSASGLAASFPEHVPASIPREQMYYWAAEWQRDVRESMKALAEGDYVDFNDPEDTNDIIRWLRSSRDTRRPRHLLVGR